MRGWPFRHTGRCCFIGALSVFAVCSLEAWANASPNYPSLLDMQNGTSCPRPLTRCLICHDTAAGGEQTANRPFAKRLKMYGLEGKSGRKLTAALQALKAEPEPIDSDGDGMSDVEELAACMNPSGEELTEGPGFGCVARLAAPAPSTRTLPALASALVACGLLVASARARRQTCRRSSSRAEDSGRR